MMRFLILGAFAVLLSGCTSTTGQPTEPRPSTAPPTVANGTIVFNRGTGTDLAVFAIGVDGGDEHQIRAVSDPAGISPDGSRFVFGALAPDGRVAAEAFDVDGSGDSLLPIADPTLQVGDLRWSPDGTRVVAQGWDDTDPSRDGLYTFSSTDGHGLVRLTAPGVASHDWPFAYSPDGSRVLFTRELKPYDHTGPMNLFVVKVDGSGLRRLNPPGTTTGLTSAPVISSASWSPDGRQVAFVASSGSFWEDQRAVFVVDTNGTNARRITPWDDTLNAVWSPDGAWIAFDTSNPIVSHDLFVVHPDGTELTPIAPTEDVLFSLGPVWSPDSRRLLFAQGPDELDNVDLWIVNVDGTGLAQVTRSPGGYGGYAWLPQDGTTS